MYNMYFYVEGKELNNIVEMKSTKTAKRETDKKNEIKKTAAGKNTENSSEQIKAKKFLLGTYFSKVLKYIAGFFIAAAVAVEKGWKPIETALKKVAGSVKKSWKKITGPVIVLLKKLEDRYVEARERFDKTRVGEATAKIDRILYSSQYIMGARLRRNNRILRRWIIAQNREVRGSIADSWHRFWARLRLRWLNFWNRKFASIHQAKVRIRMSLRRIRTAEQKRVLVYAKESLLIVIAVIRPVFYFFVAIINYVLPIAAALLLISVIHYFNTLTFAFSVEYDGEVIGYVENEAKFDEAERIVKARIINEEYLQPADSVPRFTLCVIDAKEFTSVDTLANRIITASGNDVQTAYGLYIDDEFIGATDDNIGVLKLLDARLEGYRTGAAGEVVSFVNKVKISEGIYPSTSILSLNAIEQQLDSEVEGERYYTVVAGDSPLRIANKNNMKLADLVALNPNIMKSLFGGDEVLISKSEPFLGIKVTRREVYEVEVPYGTERVSDSSLYNGVTSIKSAGVPGISEQVADVTYVDGVEVERNIISTTEITAPVNQILSVGTYIAKPSGNTGSVSGGGLNTSASFIWPTAAGKISCGWLGYSGHYAIDIAAPRGTAIFASAPGTVVFVKRLYYGYGLHLKIDHGGGVQTLYAHCSNVFVRAGDYVRQGQHIAAMGMTGRASGPHLHFEISINGKRVNPLHYL